MVSVARIFCYGDSLTAGTCNQHQLYPYARWLEQGLRQHYSADNNNNSNRFQDYQVRHKGLPGWTAQQMVHEQDSPSVGLRAILDAAPSLQLVVLMAGSNDLGYYETITSAEDIAKDILSLHQVAWDKLIPTLAIGIPPSKYQCINIQARQRAEAVNTILQQRMRSTETSRYTPFPFTYEDGGDVWDSDGLHFSPKGYQQLGEYLVPLVGSMLTVNVNQG